MATGFELSLDDLDVLANQDLPELAALMSGPINILGTVHSLGPTGGDPATAAVHTAYGAHVDLVTARQRRLCDAITETAETLREIVALYRRADGQE